MTEAVSKLWGWDAAKAEDPDLKMLCREHPKRPGSVSGRLETLCCRRTASTRPTSCGRPGR